ncbi:MAG: phosphoribosylanthranilate isomerase [Coprobacter sp.]|nr:phosphoribosylanthranilate isomerase [Coprobacter sp.]
MIVKVCGMRDADNIRQIEPLGIRLMGFVFYPPSPRYAGERPVYLPENILKTGVFVNAGWDEIQEKRVLFDLDYIQLHGGESPDLCVRLRESGVKVIKAFPVKTAEDLIPCRHYADGCDLFLFDTRTEEYGGSGRSFSWSVLESYTGPVPFLLSGGIGPDDIDKINAFRHPCWAGVDLNSRFESRPGIKNPEQLKHFIENLKKL